MADFINTIDVLGDGAVFDSIIGRTIAEFKDDRIETVRDYAFYNCSNLTEVDLPSATSVKYSAFTGCSALTKVNIPAVKAIEPYNKIFFLVQLVMILTLQHLKNTAYLQESTLLGFMLICTKKRNLLTTVLPKH